MSIMGMQHVPGFCKPWLMITPEILSLEGAIMKNSHVQRVCHGFGLHFTLSERGHNWAMWGIVQGVVHSPMFPSLAWGLVLSCLPQMLSLPHQVSVYLGDILLALNDPLCKDNSITLISISTSPMSKWRTIDSKLLSHKHTHRSGRNTKSSETGIRARGTMRRLG